MDIKTFADQVRHHDWTACMSDSYNTELRAQRHKRELTTLSQASPEHAELWRAAQEHYFNFTWELREGEELRSWQKPPAEINAAARAWVRSYAAAKGGDPDRAEAFVGEADGFYDWYNRRISTAQRIDWRGLDAWLRSNGEG